MNDVERLATACDESHQAYKDACAGRDVERQRADAAEAALRMVSTMSDEGAAAWADGWLRDHGVKTAGQMLRERGVIQ